MIFICASVEPWLADILERLQGKPVLTVGDTNRFAHQGVMINLINVGQQDQVPDQSGRRRPRRVEDQFATAATGRYR